MFPIRDFFSSKKSDKTPESANRIIQFIRMNWNPLISQDEAAYGMEYLMSRQNMDHIKRLFQNTTEINLTNENGGGLVNGHGKPIRPSNQHDKACLREMQSLNFKPLPIWEKLKNVLIAEMKKMGTVVNVRAEDPTSTAKKMQDRGFIEHKDEIEGFNSYIYTSIGQKPYQMKDHKARFGEKLENGNNDQFEKMGLDDKDPADVGFFMDFFHKLDEEITVQDIINYIASDNQWSLDIEKWVNDLLAKKAVAATTYVSDVTGKIMTKYLAPETVYIYGGGNRQDFNDADAKGYERRVTIKELIDIIGDEFDMEEQFQNLLLAITYTNRIEFNAVGPSFYRGFANGSGNTTLQSNTGVGYSYNDFLSFKITLGRIEYSSQNQQTFGEVKKDGGFYENNQSPTGKYPTKARWETPTYKAYYLAVSAVNQVMFDWGELEYADILGASDFNMNFTIITYKDTGDSLAVQSAQIIDMINEAWYKFRYELRRAKPRGRGWNYDSMVSTLMDLIPDTTTSQFNKLQKVMEMMDSSANEIYKFPIGQDGKQILLPGNQLNYDIPNGMSKESMLWWEIMMNGIQYLSDMMGIAPLREGDPGNPRDSMNNQFKALEYSQAATYYIPDMLTYLFQQMSVKAVFFTQDIITYKNYNSIAYKVLEDAVGSEKLDKLEKLGKTALHRFGIFVESLNQAPLRQKLEALIFEAVKNKTITLAQSLMIEDIKSVKEAYLTLAFFEQKNQKIADKAAQQQQQASAQQQQQIIQMQMQMERMKGDYMLQGKKMDSEAMIQSHIINQTGGLAKAEMKHASDTQQIADQATADLKLQEATLNQTGKTTPTQAPAPPQPQPQGGPAMPPAQADPGSAQGLREGAVAQNTMANQ